MNRIYLDQASTSFPKAPGVAQAMMDYLTMNGVNVNRGCYSSAYSAEEVVYETRQLLAELFHFSKCKNVIFTPNVTTSLNFILKGILKPGDHILVSAMEHNRYFTCFQRLWNQNAPGCSWGNLSAAPSLFYCGFCADSWNCAN